MKRLWRFASDHSVAIQRFALWFVAIATCAAMAFERTAGLATPLFVVFAILAWRVANAGGPIVGLVVAAVLVGLGEALALWEASLGSLVVHPDGLYPIECVALLTFAYFIWRFAREARLGPFMPLLVIVAAVGMVGAAAPAELVRQLGDGFIGAATVLMILLLATPALRRFRVGRVRRWIGDSPGRALAWAGTAAVAFDRFASANAVRYAAVAAAALTVVVAVAAPRSELGWNLVGARDGAAVSNAAFFSGALRPDGIALRDDRILTAGDAAPRVGIADSPLLTALKRLAPGRWDGVRVGNLLAIAGVWLFLWAAVLFVASLSGTRGGAFGAVLLASLATPLVFQIRAAAPFDLWPALLLALVAARSSPRWLAAASAALGMLNVADGYELAVVVLLLAAMHRLPAVRAALLAGLGIAGSLLGAIVSHLLAPDAALFATWWSTNDIGTLVTALDVEWSAIASAAGLALIAAAWVFSLANRERALRPLVLFLAISLVLALPPVFGGVPLIAPSRLFEALPVGWPSARFLDLALLLAVVPVALALRRLGGARFDLLRPAIRWAGQAALVVLALRAALPLSPHVVTPALPEGSVYVELPVAEARSRASVIFADDLIERGVRIAQPDPYVTATALVTPARSFDATMAAIDRLVPQGGVVLRDDVYLTPSLRYAEPTILSAEDYAVPDVRHDDRLELRTLTEQSRVYTLRPRG